MVLLSFAFFENVSFPLRLFPCLREYIYKKRMSEVFPSDIRFSFYHHNNYLCIGEAFPCTSIYCTTTVPFWRAAL